MTYTQDFKRLVRKHYRENTRDQVPINCKVCRNIEVHISMHHTELDKHDLSTGQDRLICASCCASS